MLLIVLMHRQQSIQSLDCDAMQPSRVVVHLAQVSAGSFDCWMQICCAGHDQACSFPSAAILCTLISR